MKHHIIISLAPESTSARVGENLGIRYIKSYLNGNGYNVDILENQFENYSPTRIAEIVEYYDVIGFSINYCGQLPVFSDVLKHIDKTNKIIYLGGHFASICYEKILYDFKEIDFVMLSDGEIATLELAKCDFNFKSNHNVAYLCDQNIVCNPIVIPEKLDILPFPYRNKNSYYMGDNHFSIISGRGCYHRCTYCSVGSFTRRYFNNRIRLRSAINIYEELKHLKDTYNVQYVTFQDDLFIGTDQESKARAIELAKLLIKQKLNIYFSIQCSVKSIDYDIFSLLYKAGLRNVMIGIENFSPNALKCFNKSQSITDVNSAVQTLRLIGVPVSYGFIMYYPEMKNEEILENINMLYNLNLINIRAMTSILQIYVGTDYCQKELDTVSIERNNYSIKYFFKDPKLCAFIEKCKRFGKMYDSLEKRIYRLEFLSHTNTGIDKQKVNSIFYKFKECLYLYCTGLYYEIFCDQDSNIDAIEIKLKKMEEEIGHLYSLI